MHLLIIVLLTVISITVTAAPPAGYCVVTVCNKLEKSTIDEKCFDTVVRSDEAVAGKILDSSTRWFSGSFNPTKKSVTRVKQVLACSK